MSRVGASIPLVIANGESPSGSTKVLTSMLGGIYMPAAWTAASLVMEVSANGTDFAPLAGIDGVVFEIIVVADAAIGFNGALVTALAPWTHVRVRSVTVGTPATPVNQGAERIIQFVAK